MKVLICLLAVFTVAHGELSRGFQFRWTSDTDNSTGYFIDVPWTVTDAVSSGWTEVIRLEGKFIKELDTYCYNNEVTFCAFYDAYGPRGFQIAILKSAFTEGPVLVEQLGYSSWRYNYLDYWTIQQFFINDASELSWDSSKLLQEDAVFVPSPASPDTLLKISDNRTLLNTTLYPEEGCVATMGSHYFQEPQNCDNLFPWFFLFDGDQLVGSGWRLYGRYTFGTEPYAPTTDLFEYGTAEFVQLTAPTAATCFSDYVDEYGLITLHVYYVEDYTALTCDA